MISTKQNQSKVFNNFINLKVMPKCDIMHNMALANSFQLKQLYSFGIFVHNNVTAIGSLDT